MQPSHLRRFQLGRLAHYTFDAVLISAFLAGVKRSTGLTLVLQMRANKSANHRRTPS